tara:strand:- start:62 stop:289 length:228 start_codon:yes stop_codon:yes gene_type:complete
MRQNNAFLNISDSSGNHNDPLSENTLHEIQMQLMNKQEFRLRYIQLRNDAQKSLGRKEAMELFQESEVIWQKLNS